MTFPFRVAVGEDQTIGTAIAFAGDRFCVELGDGSFISVWVHVCRRLTKLEEHLAGE